MNDQIPNGDASTCHTERIDDCQKYIPSIKRTCVVIGSTTLAIFCTDRIRNSGHEVRSILATDDVFRNWAIREGLRVLDSIQDLEADLLESPVDWLFSAINPFIIPASLFQWVHNGAFNYHDSPLPRYAGTYATSWALMAEETKYAVTWHRITSTVDAGRIAVQHLVVINSQDTALSLNLKCYEAAKTSFEYLLTCLQKGNVVTSSQDSSQRTFYKRTRRPKAGGCLDWAETAESLSAMVRALHFGELYANPLTCPKMVLDSDVILVMDLECLEEKSQFIPGTLISKNEKGLRVSTGSKDVMLVKFMTLEGELVNCKKLADDLQSTSQLPLLTTEQATEVKSILEHVTEFENFWHDRLMRIHPIQLPYEIMSKHEASEFTTTVWCEPLSYDHRKDPRIVVLAAFAVYLARLIGETRFQIGFRPVPLSREFPIPMILAPTVPMECAINLHKEFTDIIQDMKKEVELLEHNRTYPRDLVSRHPSLRSINALKSTKPWRIAISMEDDCASDKPAGTVLTLQIDGNGRFRWIYNTRFLGKNIMDRISQHLETLMQSTINHSGHPINRLNMIPESEQKFLINTLNNTKISYPNEVSVHQLFELGVERAPNATAIIFKEKQLSYKELNESANRLAYRLLQFGVESDTCVAILLDRSVELVVAELAILKVGAIYVPLDTTAPSERHKEIIDDCMVRLLITDVDNVFDITIFNVRKDSFGETSISKSRPPGSSYNIAYVMYTSGTTGKPKGVLVRHKAIINLVTNNDVLHFEPYQRVAFASNPGFDASTFEVWGPLLNGGTIFIIEHKVLLNPKLMSHELIKKNVDFLFLTTSLFNQYVVELADDFQHLKTLIFGGEEANSYLIKSLLTKKLPENFLHAYGPTETTGFATIYNFKHFIDDHISIPIGRPLANTYVYLFDEHNQLVPWGAVGEIFIGGCGVALGYLNLPNITDERFLADPYSDDCNARIYRTGDLARYSTDGNLIYVGRNDRQIKVRGYRIELSEIEAKICKHPAVKQTAVVVSYEDHKRIIAYVVTNCEISIAELHAYLVLCLPEYMVPSAIIKLDNLPITCNGKLDYRVLPRPDVNSFVRALYEPPIGYIEKILAEIWSSLLGVTTIGRNDSFFALGGHSLLAVRLCAQIATLGVDISLTTLFETPILADLALAIQIHYDAGNNVVPLITNISRDGSLPLSYAQQRLWFLTRIDGVSEAYHIPFTLYIDGLLHVTALQKALDTLWFRHESLRSVFINVKSGPQVRLLDPQIGLPLRIVDLNNKMDLDSICIDEAQRPFDLTSGPLIRGLLIRIRDQFHVLMLTQHHIVSDGWSLDIIIEELQTLYRSYCRGKPNPLPPLIIQYPDYASWQQQTVTGKQLQKQSDYWKAMLIDAPVLLNLPTDRPRPPQQSFAGDFVLLDLGKDLTVRLKRLCCQLDITLFMAIFGAWATVLARLSGEDEIVIGVPTANRNFPQIQNLIGFFVDVLPIKIELRNQLSVSNLLASVKNTIIQAQENQDFSLEQIVKLVQPPRRMDCTPLFQVVFAWQEIRNKFSQWEELRVNVKPIPPIYSSVKFDLELSLTEAENCISGTLAYSTALFNRHTIQKQVQYLKILLNEITSNIDCPITAINILDLQEHKLVVQTWNQTNKEYPKETPIHELFEEQSKYLPNSIAVIFGKEKLTYDELNRKSNQLAHALINAGVQPGDFIPILLERSSYLIIAQLAVLKTGAAYVPLNPCAPIERNTCIIKDCCAHLLITNSRDTILNIPTINLNDVNLHGISTSNLNLASSSSEVAYVMYTSGTTGMPKGVLIRHRGVIRLVRNNGFCDFGPHDRVGFISNPAFDASTFEIWGALLNGGTLIIIERNIILDAYKFCHTLKKEKVTIILLTPAYLNQILDVFVTVYPRLDTLIIGADVLDPRSINVVLSKAPPKRLINAYGPTESTTIATTYHIIEPIAPHSIVPIGRPISNTRIYLLNSCHQPVPLGAVGEIYIGGDGIASGYLKRDDLTNKHFFSDPFVNNTQMYKTGDLARYLPNGNLIFVGRNDEQVKIRGFRIELGEIEARLSEHPAVREVVVNVVDQSEKRLIAYVVGNEISPKSLREYLVPHLPDYMIPVAFVQLAVLPFTPNGKVDRQSLPTPETGAFVRATYEEPIGNIESNLAKIWRNLLNVQMVSRNDSFFALGGHSLLAVQLINHIRSFGTELPLATIFTCSTLSTLAAAIKHHQTISSIARPPITAITRDSTLTISFEQRRLWFLSQFDEAKGAYHVPLKFLLKGRINYNNLRQALNTLWCRHEVLRSVFVKVGGQTKVKLLEVNHGINLRIVELQDLTELDTLCAKEIIIPFEMSCGPLVRCLLIRLDDKTHTFLFTLHHIIFDGLSYNILIGEIMELYYAYHMKKSSSLEPLQIQYYDYAAWQRQWLSSDHLKKEAEYWRSAFYNAPSFLNLPTDYPRPKVQSYHGKFIPINLGVEFTHTLKNFSKRHEITLFMTLLAAWAAVLARVSGQDEIIIGTPSTNRRQPELEHLIGFFVNTLAIRVDLRQKPTISELLARVKKASVQAQAHQELPFEEIVEIVQPYRRINSTPIFQVMFAWQNRQEVSWTCSDLEINFVESPYNVVKFDMELILTDDIDCIQGKLGYSSALFSKETAERHVNYFKNMLSAMAIETNASLCIDNIDILDTFDHKLLVYDWNSTNTFYKKDACFHEIFEEIVLRSPNSVSLFFEGETLTYAELNTRANQLAHRLIELNVKPDTCIALCVERSVTMIIAFLAILKAGAAYLPLDPSYPKKHLIHILNHSNPMIVLVDEKGRMVLGEDNLSSRQLLNPNCFAHYSTENPKSQCGPRSLAYVVYTSGSTGIPKGVMIEHRGMVNLVRDQIIRFDVKATSRILQFASCSFDASIFEIVMALGSGASLYLPSDLTRRDYTCLIHYLEQQNITHVTLPPALVHACKNMLTNIRGMTFILAGEAVNLTVFDGLQVNNKIFNAYGLTETSICVTVWCFPRTYTEMIIPIGRPISNTQIYLLNSYHHPVPLGTVGEIYVGGDCVARGYLNDSNLTSQYFFHDPFVCDRDPIARMYKTGDLGYYLPDGNLVYVGRTDNQVKIRGFRIELGEIEFRLLEHPAIQEAVVVISQEKDKYLIAYIVADSIEPILLHEYLGTHLPDFMIPRAFVQLDAFPLTVNGKVDRSALPIPGVDAFSHTIYEQPVGKIEEILAKIWRELLGIDKISRYDSFFTLGGHSLLAVSMIERLREHKLNLSISNLFQSTTLITLAQKLCENIDISVPPNKITEKIERLTPDLLPLIDITQNELDKIVATVPGRLANIQDIYSLSPLQEGILFHHLSSPDNDPYVAFFDISFNDRSALDNFIRCMQLVVNRHDILRTSFVWKGLSLPAQVVWRNAPLSTTEVKLNPRDGLLRSQLLNRFKIDLSVAPVLHLKIVRNAKENVWFLTIMLHHLIGDHSTMDILLTEVNSLIQDSTTILPTPVPYRNLIAKIRKDLKTDTHNIFFKAMLGDILTPTLPFELNNVKQDGSRINESRQILCDQLNKRLRAQAKRLNVNLASLCHVAYAQVLSIMSSQEHVVFGTVLLGRMQVGQGVNRSMGLFINTLPIRIDLDNSSVEDSVCRTHVKLGELLEHENASLLLAQRCSGVPASTPLFSALLNYRHASTVMDSDNKTYVQMNELFGIRERNNYPLTVSIEDFGTRLGVTAQIESPFEPERVCRYMEQALSSLVESLEHNPRISVEELRILHDDEQELLVNVWNDTNCNSTTEICIHQLFEQQVERTPHATAVISGSSECTYATLNSRANILARQLVILGIVPDEPVVICLERSISMIVGLLAILKAGAAYVPLDFTNPTERISQILNDICPKVILADDTGQRVLKNLPLTLTIVDPSDDFQHSPMNLDVIGLTSYNLSYIIYTSGSTGAPKGVQNEHRAVVNRLLWQRNIIPISSDDRVLQKTPLTFDVSVWEIFFPLLNGAIMVLAPPYSHKYLDVLADLIVKKRVTIMHSVPSMLQSLLTTSKLKKCYNLKYLICSGESLSIAHIQLCQKVLPHIELFNLYGPTEAAIDVTYWKCPTKYEKVEVPIGRPIANTRIYLLNKNGLLLPIGAVGEVCIGGIAVARGYHNRSDLSAKCFVSDPFSDDPNARMYKTGDLAKYMPDGNLLFLGRNDQQVKIRGVRIEPGEIEDKLTAYPGIRNAVVIATEKPNSRLIAYVVADEVEPVKLRRYLNSLLPESMLPSAFVGLDELPLMLNGKLDRKALPAADENALAHAVYEKPIGSIECILAEVWQELLNVQQVSRNDSFFALGGHSLLVIQMMERLQKHNLELSVQKLFENPVLACLATTLKKTGGISIPPNSIVEETELLTPNMLPLINLSQDDINQIIKTVPHGIRNIQDIYAATPLQEGILFHHLLNTFNDPFLLVSQMVFTNRDFMNRYVGEFQKVIERHDILRTAFIYQGLSVPAQVVWRQAPLSITELLFDSKNGSISEQSMAYCKSQKFKIDVTSAPLLKFLIVPDNDHWILNIAIHHLICDHTTIDILLTEVKALLENKGNELPPAMPFRNFIAQIQTKSNFKTHERFFKHMLADVTEPTLPFGVANRYADPSKINEAHLILSSEINKKLRYEAKKLNVSVASLCHVAWAQVLSCTSDTMKVVFGTVLFGRMQAGEGSNQTMGMFINTLPIRIDVHEAGITKCIRNVHSQLAGLLEHELAPLSLAQRCSRIPSGTPIFSALLNYRHNSELQTSMSGIEVLKTCESTIYPFTLSVEDSGTRLGLTALIHEPIDPVRVCRYMETALDSLVSALEKNPDLPVHNLEILPESERQLLSKKWNEVHVPYLNDTCIHQLFEEQVERTPGSPALLYKEKYISYANLNSKTNILAHKLIASGVKSESLVAICVMPSPAMIIGIFAILKAGAAYVPLDPNNPNAKLLHILTDSNPVIVLADHIGRKALGNGLFDRTVLDPNDDFEEFHENYDLSRNPQISDLGSRNLAYVIYTSGSTGTPKGAMVEHRSLVNYSLYAARNYKIRDGKGSLLATSIAFDLVLTSLFPPLISGVPLRIPSDKWNQVILREQYLSPVKITPSHLAFFQNESALDTLRDSYHTFVIGGEQLYASAIKDLFDRNPKLSIFNEYGPTESTVGCVVYEVTSKSMNKMKNIVPIGRPICNTRIYIVDSFGRLAPLGAVGEIYIGGHSLARGYLNLPDLTLERFLPDPFVDDPEARIYKTGDLARFLPDGNLIFLGRNDEQIKVRGYRVEPAEIEAKLLQNTKVREAHVTTFGDNNNLIAYVVADCSKSLFRPEPDMSPSEPETVAVIEKTFENNLRESLRSCLPDYMIPTIVMKVDKFQLTSNGKIDRDALPSPKFNGVNSLAYKAPVGSIEEILAEIWCELLEMEKIGRFDSFFALGGHSLLAVKMINRAMRSGLICSLNELFENPILADFAARLSPSLSKRDVEAILVRSGSEKPIFFVPTGLGDHSYVFSIAGQISEKYPIYALPWPLISETSKPSVESLAKKMMEFIKNVQPKGPYRIAGYSAGGILSYAIAKSLLDLGDTVEFIGFIDTLPPHLLKKLSVHHLFFNYLEQIIGTESTHKLIKLIENKNEIDFVNVICDPEQLKLLGINVSHEHFIKSWERIQFFYEAVQCYELVPLTVDIHQFHSTEEYESYALSKGNIKLILHNAEKAWQEILPDAHVHSIPIPGNHYTMITDIKNRKQLGDALSRVLESNFMNSKANNFET